MTDTTTPILPTPTLRVSAGSDRAPHPDHGPEPDYRLVAHLVSTPVAEFCLLTDAGNDGPGDDNGCDNGDESGDDNGDENKYVVVAAGFCPPSLLVRRLTSSGRARVTTANRPGPWNQAIADYFDGRLDALDRIPVRQSGTDMQHDVWNGLRTVAPGRICTYSELAALVDRPTAARAAGMACGRNLVALIVPCHRAVPTTDALGGYAYGLDVKRWLLDHEARHAS